MFYFNKNIGGFVRKKLWEKIAVDRKIIEHFIEGKSATEIQKIFKKGKGYILSIRDRAIAYSYIKEIIPGEKRYKQGTKKLPPFPESPFAIIDTKSEKLIETDKYLEPEKPWIAERVAAGWCPQSIFEELKSPLPRASFYRYMHRNDFMKAVDLKKSPAEIIHSAGECLQVDWAKLCDVVDPKTGKKKTISIFIGILGFSRYQMVRVVESLNFSTTISILQSMLSELGGVPRKITSDNPKVFVTTASKYEPTCNPGYERFASHYGFCIEALPPSDPESKGKVERSVQFVRRLFETYDFKNYDMKTAQDHIDKKNEVANLRKHGSHLQKPVEVFLNNEAGELRPLPSLAFEIETMTYSKVRLDGYVRFENKYYRVHDKFRGHECLIIGSQKQVTIYSKGLLLDIYDRVTDPFTSKACKDHYKQDFEKTLKDHGHYINRGKKLGEDVGRFVEMILARGEGFVDLRVIWGLLSLDKKYEAKSINSACREAIELSQVNLKTVMSLLRIMAEEKKPTTRSQQEEEFKLTNGKYTSPMSEYKKHLHLV